MLRTIADISYYLTYIKWDGFGVSSITWTIVLLIAATTLALAFAGKNQDWCYPLVFVWAFIGIGIRNSDAYPVITDISYILAAITFIVSITIFIKNRRKNEGYGTLKCLLKILPDILPSLKAN